MFEQVRNKIPLDNQKWDEYISYFKQIKVLAKTMLLKEGDISKKVFFIEKGCVRV